MKAINCHLFIVTLRPEFIIRQLMRGFKILTAIVLCLLSASGVMAQTDSIKPGIIRSIGNRLDTKAFFKYDSRYIEVPERPWRVILRSRLDEFKTDFTNYNSFDYDDITYRSRLEMNLDSKVNKSVGLWVGYRGLGIGYYYKIDKKPGANLYLSATGAKFGLNFRFRSMKYDQLHAKMDYLFPDTAISYIDDDAYFWEPIDVLSFYFDGYYVFNGKKYSQAAAYNQAVIQKKSAGSLLLGVTLYASGIDMAYNKNASLIFYCDSVGSISLGKIAIGLGYGYNWVPARGWTINAMVMPNISVSDNVILSKYECNYDMIYFEDDRDYGKWDSNNHVWENGETHKNLTLNEYGEAELPQDVEIWKDREDNQRTRWAFNYDVRVGISYCWRRYFVSANAIFNNFEYGRNNNKVNLIDWYTTFSLGIRL